MKLLVVAATIFEISPLLQHLENNFQQKADFVFEKDGLIIQCLITGVGIPNTILSLARISEIKSFQLILNAGICGSFSEKYPVGTVVNIVADRFADLGVEQADGSFTDIFEMGLQEKDEAPYENGWLKNGQAMQADFLKNVKAITVNKVHGQEKSIAQIKGKYQADVESMEGAAFFLFCKSEGLNFLAIRSVSNFVEPRNKENWDIPLAIENLNTVLVEMIGSFS